eukprot:1769100-Amphidinium_carterae.1
MTTMQLLAIYSSGAQRIWMPAVQFFCLSLWPSSKARNAIANRVAKSPLLYASFDCLALPLV